MKISSRITSCCAMHSDSLQAFRSTQNL